MSAKPVKVHQRCARLLDQFILDFFERMYAERMKDETTFDTNFPTPTSSAGKFQAGSEFLLPKLIELEIYKQFITDVEFDDKSPDVSTSSSVCDSKNTKDPKEIPFLFAPYEIKKGLKFDELETELKRYMDAYQKKFKLSGGLASPNEKTAHNTISAKLREKFAAESGTPGVFDASGGEYKEFQDYWGAAGVQDGVDNVIDAVAKRFGFDTTTANTSATPKITGGTHNNCKVSIISKLTTFSTAGSRLGNIEYFTDGKLFGKIT